MMCCILSCMAVLHLLLKVSRSIASCLVIVICIGYTVIHNA